jgi:hypothetical protein
VYFQGFARRKIFLALHPAPRALRGGAGGGAAAVSGGGREPRPPEAVMAVEFARKLEHPAHRQKIMVHATIITSLS